MSKQAYQPIESRKDINGYTYLNEDSNQGRAVYKNGDKYVLAYKGTSTLKDLAPDAAIAAGIQEKSSDFQNADKDYKELKQKYGGTWDVTGHSLGGTKAMMVAQNNNLNSYVFNPGFVAPSDDRIDTSYKGNNYYLVKGDPISNSLLSKPLENLKVLPGEINVLKNHGIDNFVKP